MSTYVMSDIHGRLRELKEMLVKIKFNPKEDRLYLLGDYVDWGEESIEVIKFLIENKEGITCLMGNHDLMMLETIQAEDFQGNCSRELVEACYNSGWAMNGGVETLRDYLNLSKQERKEIRVWLESLEYSKEIEANGKRFYLCHSAAKLGNMTERNIVWDRVKYEYLERFKKEYPDEILISGHTIQYDNRDKHDRICILKDMQNRYIGIDCGAKAMDSHLGYRLGALRLEDMVEEYVGN